MKILIFVLAITLVGLNTLQQPALANAATEEVKLTLTEPYLGQNASTTQATIFAPGIVSTANTEVLYGLKPGISVSTIWCLAVVMVSSLKQKLMPRLGISTSKINGQRMKVARDIDD